MDVLMSINGYPVLEDDCTLQPRSLENGRGRGGFFGFMNSALDNIRSHVGAILQVQKGTISSDPHPEQTYLISVFPLSSTLTGERGEPRLRSTSSWG